MGVDRHVPTTQLELIRQRLDAHDRALKLHRAALRSPTVPMYDPDMPLDAVDGQIALKRDDIPYVAPTRKPYYFENGDWHPFMMPGLAGGPGLDDTILGLAPDAFYKLDDASGDAIDLSGGGHNLSATGAPTRGEAAGPPGTLTTGFPASNGFGGPSVADGYTPATAADFSVAGYVYRTDNLVSYLFGQGNPVASSTAGWALGIEAFNQGTGNRLVLYIGGTGGPFAIEGNNALAIDTWYHLAVTRISGVWRIYVDGLLQTATYSGTGATASYAALPFWIGYNNISAQNASTIRGSYVTVFATRGLSGGEVLSIPTVAITGGVPADGEVPIANGDGTVSYGFPTYTVYVDGA